MEITNSKDIKDLFESIDKHLLEDEKPEDFMNTLNIPAFNSYPFNLLNRLKSVEQSPKHHPEGNVWEHTMLVIHEAAAIKHESSDARVFMWAALLHDIGKAETTQLRNGKITAYDHDKVGAERSREFLSCFVNDEDFISKVSVLVRWHMQILYVVNSLPFANIEGMKKDVNINDIALLGLCDRLGRGKVDFEKEKANMTAFLKKINRKS